MLEQPRATVAARLRHIQAVGVPRDEQGGATVPLGVNQACVTGAVIGALTGHRPGAWQSRRGLRDFEELNGGHCERGSTG